MGWTCLIVDDESDTCWAIEHVLGRCAIRCTRALTAAAALGQMQPGAFDLAILDVKLPDLDGIELARLIRVIDPRLPILVVSGYFYRHDATIEQAQAEGLILDFIAKPFQHQELTQAVERALAR
jgi:DNA-binding NtrC family response regulator